MSNWWDSAPLADAKADETIIGKKGDYTYSVPGSPPAEDGAKWWESAPLANAKKEVSDAVRPFVGANRAIASMAGAPVDAATYGINKLSQGATAATNAVLGTDFQAPQIKDPFGGSESIKRGMGALPMGGANPDDVRPAGTTGEKLLEEAGAGAASMVIPGLTAETVLAKTLSAGETFGKMALDLIKGSGATSNATMGAAGGVVGELAAEEAPEGYKDLARMGGGLAGGVGAAGAMAAGSAAGSAAGALVRPMTAGGREVIAGRTLNKLADDPAKSIANMDAYESGVPGFNITAAKASRDDSLMATENALNAPGSGFGQRVNANNEALTKALDTLDAGGDPKAFIAELTKLDAGAAAVAKAAVDALPQGADAGTAGQAIQKALRGRFDDLVTARKQATEPLYAEAREDPTAIKPFSLLMSTADAVAANKGDLKAAAERVRALLFDADGKVDRTAAGMMATRDAVTDMIGAAPQGSKQQRMLLGFKNQIEDILEAVPAERLARQTFAEKSKPLDAFNADKGSPAAANVVEKERFGENFTLAPERVAAQFFRPGDAGAATMREFVTAADGNPSAITAMKSFIADKARAADDPIQFLQKNRPAIEALDKDLARQLEDVAATKSISSGFRASPAGKFIDNDYEAATRLALNAPDATKRMQALRTAVGGSEEAVQGLQRAVINDFRRAALAPIAQDAAGNPRLMAAAASKWLTSNRGAAINVLTPQQVAGLEAITTALADQAQTAVKVAGSDTTRNLATLSVLEALIGRRGADAAFLSPLRKTLNLVYGDANEKVLQTLTNALLEPSVAAALMRKATAGNSMLAERALERVGAVVAANQPKRVEENRQ